MPSSEKKFLTRLYEAYGRYMLCTTLGSMLLLLCLDWQAEKSFLVAAGLGMLLELALDKGLASKRSRLPEQIEADFQQVPVSEPMPAELKIPARFKR